MIVTTREENIQVYRNPNADIEQMFERLLEIKETIKSLEKFIDSKKNDSLYSQVKSFIEENGETEEKKINLYSFVAGFAWLQKKNSKKFNEDFTINYLKEKKLYNKVKKDAIDETKLQYLFDSGQITEEEFNNFYTINTSYSLMTSGKLKK